MQKQRFSLRKYKFGLASVVLGTFLVIGAAQAQADEQAANPVGTQEARVVTTAESNSQVTTSVANTESAVEKTDASVATPGETPQQTEAAQVDTVSSSAETLSNTEVQSTSLHKTSVL
ncbi:YSIRK type signal peptide [Streptococcus constellatus]|uniref:YSIRK type signal peptide n=1 Tax=Streptococcus constellatus TaxID=76860 RepID=A0A564TSJ0_STRCV|nr:YSIRK type signal peptide [Streptococcus gordonii]VUX10219.1 YSIRK type signal peptide [Streptococcus constellatus]